MFVCMYVCLISLALIGSFISSIRVRTDKSLIYESFQPFKRSAVKLSTKVANQKARKAIDNVRAFFHKIHLALFTASLQRLFHSFISGS